MAAKDEGAWDAPLGGLPFHLPADSVPVVLWVCGSDKRCAFVNAAWREYTGRTLADEQGDGWVASVHPEDRARTLATYGWAFDAREPCRVEYRLRRADGRYRWFLSTGAPLYARPDAADFLGYVGSAVDIDERRELEAQLRQAHEMEAIGRLAGSLAHDFNNLLAVIAGYAEILLRDELSEVHRVPVLEIQRATERAAALTRQLLASGTPAAVLHPAPVAGLAAGRGTVLLVEDEAGVRELLASTLRTAGYQVLEAANAREADLLLASHRGRVDLLLTDLVMPGESGFALARRLAAARPGLKVVCMSGYPGEALGSTGGAADFTLVPKPFSLAQLTRILGKV